MVKVSVPNFFRCPITLEMMRDPVTLSTGHTYERRSIEEWLETGHNTCPSTMQVLSSKDIAPNHTLARLIRHWCASNNGYGAIELPPEQPERANLRQVKQMLEEVVLGVDPSSHLRKLKSLAKESNDENREVLERAGVVSVLGNFVFSPENLEKNLQSCEEALEILVLLPLENIRRLIHIGAKQLTVISWLLCRGSLRSKINAALLLASLAAEDFDMKSAIGKTAGVFEGLVQLLKEDLCPRAMDAGLKAVLAIITFSSERNKVRAVQAGVVFAVVQLLPEAEKRRQEQALAVLAELITSCVEGREAASAHALVVPVLVRIIGLRDVASESALLCLWTLCRYFPNKCLDEVAGQAGILTYLSQLVDSESTIHVRTREIAMQLLQHLRYTLRNCDSRS